jgi:hypothetical protein
MAKQVQRAAKQNPRRRRRNPRRKNMKGSTVALIVIGVVVGLPVLAIYALKRKASQIWHGAGVRGGGEESANGFTAQGGTWSYRVWSEGQNVGPNNAAWCMEFTSSAPNIHSKDCLNTYDEAIRKAQAAVQSVA